MSEDKKYWSSAPFIAHDGKDDNGVSAEVKVVKGYGLVDSIEASKKGNALNITFEYGGEYQSSGWAQKDSDIAKVCQEAKDNNEPLYFRIESRRKNNVDRTLPFSEISPKSDAMKAKKNIYKSLSAVKRDDDDNWTTGVIVTKIENDDKLQNYGGIHSAYNDEDDNDGVAIPPSQSFQPNRNRSSVEPPPWVTNLRDGSISPGSVAGNVPMIFYTFLWNYEKDSDLRHLSDKQRFVATKVLMQASGELQRKVWDNYSENVRPADLSDLSASSHTRARGVIFECIKMFYPIPVVNFNDDDNDSFNTWKESLYDWKENLVEKGLAMWLWSLKEVGHIN